MSTDLIRSTPWMRPHASEPRPPRTIVNAARLMYAGAAVELATLITIVVTAGRGQVGRSGRPPGGVAHGAHPSDHR
jgi:hypothetical protein